MTMEKVFGQVGKIVLRVSKEYPILAWSAEDWEQEGYIFLYHFLFNRPYLLRFGDEFCGEYEGAFRSHIEELV